MMPRAPAQITCAPSARSYAIAISRSRTIGTIRTHHTVARGTSWCERPCCRLTPLRRGRKWLLGWLATVGAHRLAPSCTWVN